MSKFNIIRKYNTLALPIKAGIWFTISSFLQKGISFLTMPIFTRLLTTEEFGAVTIFNSWESIFLILITFNVFWGIFNTAMIDFKTERDKYTSSLIGFLFTSSILWIILYCILRNYIDSITGLSTELTLMMFIQVFFQSVVSVWIARLKFEYNYYPVLISTFILFGVSPILSIIGIKFFPSMKVEAKIAGNLLAYIFVGIFAIINMYNRGKCIISYRYWKYAFIYGAPLIIHYLSSVILGQCDRIMISSYNGDHYAALYAVSYSIAMILTILTSSANQAIVPWLYKSIEDNILYRTVRPIYYLFIIVAVCLTAIMLIGPELITLLSTSEYYEAVIVIPPITVSIFFTFIYMVFANIEFFYKKNKFIVTSSVIAAIVNIMLNYLLIPRYGYVSAAYTTLFCYIVFGCFHYLCSKKIVLQKKLYWPFNGFFLFSLSIILFIVLYFVLYLYNFRFPRYCVLILIISILIIYRNKIQTTLLNIKK